MVRAYLASFLLIGMLGLSVQASQVDDLKKEVEAIRKEIAGRDEKSAAGSNVDAALSSKYGPNTAASTKTGKLQIGGLLQVWFQHIDNDKQGILVAGANAQGLNEVNSLQDNDTFRIRRTELRFSMDIHENITAYVMMDPARESNILFTPAPTFPFHNDPFGTNNIKTGAGQQAGNTIIPQLLQDAYINFHGVVPHHDFTIGQFKPPAGEEAWRNSGQLEFIERSMVTGVNNVRDIGAMMHGTWLENRVQYWVGAFNGPDGTVLTDPEIYEGGNRSDDNDAKDIAVRLAVRPVWDAAKWYGRLEVGGSRTDGIRGETGHGFDPTFPAVGLNRAKTDINKTGAWVWYRPGNEVRGWWLRGEYGNGHDHYGPTRGTATGMLGLGGNAGFQTNPRPVTVEGWYFGTGYKMSDSRWAAGLKSGNSLERALHNMEFAFRYETYQNLATEDLIQPDTHTDQFKTSAYTGGVNYYIRGHDAKIQANYIWVNDPNAPNHFLREAKNNQFIVSFQVMF